MTQTHSYNVASHNFLGEAPNNSRNPKKKSGIRRVRRKKKMCKWKATTSKFPSRSRASRFKRWFRL